jgi:putative ABC transport system permease protein
VKGLKADLLHALRLYAKTPASSLLAVVILAAAMAVVTAFASMWNELGLRAHPGFEAGGRLVTVGQSDRQRFFPVPMTLIERATDEATTIASIAGIGTIQLALDPASDAEPLAAELVTREYFEGLRPRLRLGRPFDARDHAPDAEPVVILSDAFWRNEFSGRPEVLGQTVQLWGRSPFQMDAEPRALEHRIVGVLAPTIRGTFPRSETSVWLPREQFWPSLAGDTPVPALLVRAVARLAPGASVHAARNELEGRFADVLSESSMVPGARIDLIAGIINNPNAHRDALRQIYLFLAGSVLLALAAACNVSLFLLSRAPGRRRELAIRMAVGASLRRLARQLATESGLLVVLATAAGLVASLWVAVLTRELAFLRRIQWNEVTTFDWRVLGMVVGLMLVLTVLVSLAPIASLKRIGIAAGSRSVTARPGWGQRLAGTTQLTVAAVIAACAIAFVWYLNAVAAIDRGFSATDVLVLRVEGIQPGGSAPDVEAARQEREHRRNVISALPGVEGVAFGTAVPGTVAMTMIAPVAPPDDPQARFSFDQFAVDAAYFDLLNLSLIDGRALEPDERDRIVINETLARRLWGRTDVAGELLPRALPPNVTVALPQVVGVVRDITFGHPSDEMPPTGFVHSGGVSPGELILIRTTASTANVRRMLQERIDAGELEFQIQSIDPVEEAWDRVLAPDRARTTLTLAAALLVLALTAFGYLGTQRFLVDSGRREFAILAALGAGPKAIGRLVLGRGLLQGLPGLVLGSLFAFIVVAWLRDDFLSHAVRPATVTALVAAGIAGLLLAATLGPAYRARSTNPGPLLKEE